MFPSCLNIGEEKKDGQRTAKQNHDQRDSENRRANQSDVTVAFGLGGWSSLR